jgi:two-component system nitrate/nitrite response regulator NarL
VRVVFLTRHEDVSFARRALEEGAAGFVLEQSASVERVTAIRAAPGGGTHPPPLLAGDVLAAVRPSPSQHEDPACAPTPRQREVSSLLSEGRSAKETAARLGISPRTVELHEYPMRETSDLRTSVVLIHIVLEHRLLEP